jgi:uncharacterized membrane protein YdbT with pleckstrin-like domain
MRYVDQVLQPGETIRYVTTITWVAYLPGLCFSIAAGIVASLSPQSLHTGALVLSLALLGWGIVLLVRGWWRRWTTEVAVTDRRIIWKRGFINRRTVEMNMDKVASVDVIQSILGRVFNYGDVIIRGPGVTAEPLRDIDRPLELRNQVTAV